MIVREDLTRSGAAIVEEGQGGIRVTPPSVASLARVVAVVRAHGLPLRVRGSGDAPANAPDSGVLLDLGSLDRIGSVDAGAGLVRVEAGCSVAALESTARRAGCTLGPLLPSVRAGSVGAWLAGPTRGLRGAGGSRRESAALTVAAVLADGRIAEGRAAPAKAVGPDLDHLTLGGAGRLSIIAAAWIRLFPATPQLSANWTCPDVDSALAAVERLCRKRLAPARARIHAGPEGTRLALAWEGIESAAIDMDRADRELSGSFPRERDVQPKWVREGPDGHPIEVESRWASLRAWSAQGDIHLVGPHAGGAFAVIGLPEARGAEECAALARAAGMRVIAPRLQRDAGPGWEAAGAGMAWSRLLDALGVSP